MKKEFQERFKKAFPEHRLLAVQLNGFSHKAFCDKGPNTDIEVMEYSGYMANDPDLTSVFQGVGHSSYQNNAQEIVYIMPKERNL